MLLVPEGNAGRLVTPTFPIVLVPVGNGVRLVTPTFPIVLVPEGSAGSADT